MTLTAGNGTQNRSVDPIELQPGEHRTFFLEEIFGPGLEVEDGTLLLRSDQPLAVTALRTRSGLPVASLPAASPEDPNQYVP